MEITSLDIELALARYFNPRQNLMVPNISWGMDMHECDMLIMSKSGYLTEVEIKISASDLKRDQEKRHGHIDGRIKALYFAIPEVLLKHEILIPERAGILVIRKSWESARYGRFEAGLWRKPKINAQAPALTEAEKFNIARLGALRMWTLKRKIQKQEK